MRWYLFLSLVGFLCIAACSEDAVQPTANNAPQISIVLPGSTATDTTAISLVPELRFRATDRDDTDLSLRWIFVSTAPFAGDWEATEDKLHTDPGGFNWKNWVTYAPGDSGMAVTDTIPPGAYVLASQARDTRGGISVLGAENMRRVIAAGASPLRLAILSPPRSVDPIEVSSYIDIVFDVSTENVDSLALRAAWVPTGEHRQDWDETETWVSTNPEGAEWGDWISFPEENGGTFTFRPPLPTYFRPYARPYVLAVQARDADGALTALDGDNLRRVLTVLENNTAPTASIAVPPSNGTVPVNIRPISTFTFGASDTDNFYNDLAVRWAMVNTADYGDSWTATIAAIQADPGVADWSSWIPYAPGGVSIDPPPIPYGQYILAAQARDPHGARSALKEPSNLRRVVVTTFDAGPMLTVYNRLIGSLHTNVIDTSPVITDLFGGVPITFRWSADASSYGSRVTGYRYGWNITDFDDDSQWDTDWVPYDDWVPYHERWATSAARTFDFGTQTFHVEVRDHAGFRSRAEYVLNVVLYQPDRNLLLIDDFAIDESAFAGWDHPTTRGAYPTDVEHDIFWLQMLLGVDGFDPSTDVIDVDRQSDLPISQLARYRAVIWSVYSDIAQATNSTLLSRFVESRPIPRVPNTRTGYQESNLVAQFMTAGGKVLVTGRHPMVNTINREATYLNRLPFKNLHDHTYDGTRFAYMGRLPGAESFGYLDLCAETIDYAVANFMWENTHSYGDGTDWYNCSAKGLRTINTSARRETALREAIPIDPLFPRLRLHEQTAGMGKYYDPAVRGMNAELYNTRYFFDACPNLDTQRNCFEPIYGLHCLDATEPTYGEAVAFWIVPEGGGARSAWFGVPLVYFEESEAKQVIDEILYGEWGLSGVKP